MQKIEITPQKARVKGNLIPNFEEMETPPNIEDFHVSHQKYSTHKYQGVEKSIIRLTPAGEKLYMTVSCTNTSIVPSEGASIISATLYYKTGGVNVNLQGQTVYIYDNDVLLKTLVSDANGQISYEYSSSVEGNHNIRLNTVYSNGYDPVSKTITIHVYMTTRLTLEPERITIGHDEIIKLSGKLTNKSEVGIGGKEIVLYEGIGRIMGRATTNNKGEYKYSYMESTNRGVPTVLTCTNDPLMLVQNQENTITGYLKTEDGTPISNQIVRLYYSRSAYQRCQSTTNSSGKFSLKYTPPDNNEYPYYIVFASTVVSSTNQYTNYEPSFLELGTLKPKKSPTCELTSPATTIRVSETIQLQCKVMDDNYNFEGETITLQNKTTAGTSWTTIATLTLDSNGVATYNWKKTTNLTYNIRFRYNGNNNYASNDSNIETVEVSLIPITLQTTLPNDKVVVMMDYYPISTIVKDDENNPVANETIMYYFDSEVEQNLMGSAITNNEGVASLTTWSGSSSNWNHLEDGVVETHTIIAKHVASNKYGAKTESNTITLKKRMRQVTLSCDDVIELEDIATVEATLKYRQSVNNSNITLTSHRMDLEIGGSTQQPLLLMDYKSIYAISTTATTLVETHYFNGEISTGAGYITYYKYPFYVWPETDETHTFYLYNNSGTSQMVIMRLNADGTYRDKYSFALPNTTYGQYPIIQVEVKGTKYTIRCINTGKTIVTRDVPYTASERTHINNTRYIGFYCKTNDYLRILDYHNTIHPILYQKILRMDNWTYFEANTTGTKIQPNLQPNPARPFYFDVGANYHIYFSKRNIDANIDRYIKVTVYQEKTDLKVGLIKNPPSNSNSTLLTDYVTYNEAHNTSSLNDFVTTVYEIRLTMEGKAHFIVDGIDMGEGTQNYLDSDTYLYLCSPHTDGGVYVQSVEMRQTKIEGLLTDSLGIEETLQFGGYGEYDIKAIAPETTNYYYSESTKKTIRVTDKEIPSLEISNIKTKKGTNYTITANVEGDETGTYTIRAFDSDNVETVIAEGLSQSNGTVSYTTNFSTFTPGRYTYEVAYTGDDTYIDIRTRANLNIYDTFQITNNQHISNTITLNTKTNLTLSGTVNNIYSEPHTGTLKCILNGNTTNIPINNGSYNGSINLIDNALEPGTYNLVLRCTNSNPNITKDLNLTLSIVKETTSIMGSSTAVLKGGNSPLWSCRVPKDFTGTIQVYLMENGTTGTTDYETGSASTSLISTTAMSNKTNYSETVSGEYVTVKWQGWYTNNSGTIKNSTGSHRIMYKLYDDTFYGEANSFATLTVRQPANITVENVRRFEDENATLNLRVTDILGEEYTGELQVKINGTNSGTVQINNGLGTYTLDKQQRAWNVNTNHLTTVQFDYNFVDSGYWTIVNASATSKSYNIKTDTAGVFVNSNSNFTSSMATYFKGLNITDLYVRSAENNLTLLENVLDILDNLGIRSFFRIHAVINCLHNTSTGTWYTVEQNGLMHIDMTRLSTLHTHINNLLKKDIDGICFDYIRRGSSESSSINESEVTTVLTDLTTFVKNKTPDKTIMISACVTPDYTNATTTYGQNYKTFEENLDYIIPMLYLFDFSSVNTTTPVNSEGYYWQHTVLYQMRVKSGLNKVIPAIETYHGDDHTDIPTTLEEYLYQTLGMWNYGVWENGTKYTTQKGIIYFRAGLMGNDPPNHAKMISTTDTTYQIELQPKLNSSTISKNTGQVKITWKNKWGGSSGYGGRCSIKIDGTTYKQNGSTYYFNINNSVTLNFDLSSYSTGTHTLSLEAEGLNERHIKSGAWSFTISLTT